MKQEKAIKILQDVIRLESVNENEAIVAEYFANLVKGTRIQTEIIEYSPMRHNIIMTLEGGQAGPVLVLNGHLDVVDVGTLEDWTYPPFAAEIHDGKMYGRGTTDMKAGLTAMVIALLEIEASGLEFAGTLKVIGCVGEEIGMLGSKQLVEGGYIDDVDAMIIGEPSGKAEIITSHKGSIQFEIIGHGRAAHSSMPEQGINALEAIREYMNRTNELFKDLEASAYNPILGRTINVYTVIEGGDQINSVPARVSLKGNARIIPETGNQPLVDILEKVAAEMTEEGPARIEVNIMQNNPAMKSDDDAKLVLALQEAVGEKVPTVGLYGATDASNFSQAKKRPQIAIYGPGAMNLAHAVDEYVEVAEYLEFIDIYRQAAINYFENQ